MVDINVEIVDSRDDAKLAYVIVANCKVPIVKAKVNNICYVLTMINNTCHVRFDTTQECHGK